MDDIDFFALPETGQLEYIDDSLATDPDVYLRTISRSKESH